MSSIFSRRHGQTFTRTGRSTPDLLSSNASKLEQPKPPVNSLYHLDVVDASSVIIPSVITYSSPQTPEHSMSPASSSSHKSVPPRSHTVQPTTNNFSFPTMNPSSAGPSAAQRPKRAPTPPPPMNKSQCPKRKELKQSRSKLAKQKKPSPNGIESMMPSKLQDFDRRGIVVLRRKLDWPLQYRSRYILHFCIVCKMRKRSP
ncbi:hypothetical protein PGTUg99_037410 [Puccinia graminis f. sp. tritici]|uniref:Uncharacterized protein n=1 Tax=Puccinia graminis f. sp. tritici TaxID=56615 RepID=A0A5B0MJJ7_PUCGR|nr:hypothetical protein PGTUg99_037410 [Puccinia graminis f. sp. tritici]